jgi:hypothetical protein
MASALVVLIYLVALAFPVYLLWHFRAQAWYWHMLSVAAALALGFVPTPPGWKMPAFDLVFGFSFIFLMVWGIGGLVLFPSREDHGHHERRHHV